VRKTKVSCVAFICTIVLALQLFSVNAFAALLGWDLVDSGKHLDYDGNSSYMSSVTSAVNTWENYKSGIIRQDSWSVIQDVYVSDYYEASDTLGVTSSSGTIKFNTYNFSTMTSAQRQKTATHEFGHALGLDHTTGTNDVMRQGLLSTTALSSTDKSSYDAAYATY
jgi:hypothetical protein